MSKFTVQLDPLTGEHYIETPFKGHLLVETPIYNKGSAFTEIEREELDLYGILPEQVSSIEDQAKRAYENYTRKPIPIEKYIYLLSLLDRNETLFYYLVLNNAEEMLPIIYTPTVGEASQTYSHLFRRPRGLYISANKTALIDRTLKNAPFSNVSLIVITDGERILGLGDQGVGGMAIPVGKISLYVVGAGLHPALCLPILVDVGTNNEELLKDPLYLGLRHKRLTGDAYDSVVEEFVKGVKRSFPNALIQWEDFGKHNALPLLNRYRERICSFDDDIQGTGAVTLAVIYAAMRSKNENLKDQRYVIFGCGQAGYGIAHTLIQGLIDEGLSVPEAKERIFAIDKDGLLLEGMAVDEYQKPLIQKRAVVSNWQLKDKNHIGLFDTVVNTRATVLIGVSAIKGAFTQDILAQMAKHTSKPLILALSNPTHKSECTPEDAFKATNNKCLIATGSPFPPVKTDGVEHKITQCNNMYIFPGMGLGAIISMTPKITDQMFITASKTLASMLSANSVNRGYLLPDLKEIRKVSENVAFAVAQVARDVGSGIRLEDDRLRSLIKNAMWEPRYHPYRYVKQNLQRE